MDYHKFLNRQIVLFTAVEIFQAIAGWFRGGRRHTWGVAGSVAPAPMRPSLPDEPLILKP